MGGFAALYPFMLAKGFHPPWHTACPRITSQRAGNEIDGYTCVTPLPYASVNSLGEGELLGQPFVECHFLWSFQSAVEAIHPVL
ncbi:hypothetical protein PCANC_11663 [Puccinia coronata f. sp. avenae]|uniref:Uncharacterized protein n=1 Tax=Puccinia coronata f. sp. avenae TaxID=200324 RepID=A0A2N5VXH2_9BASI|nr:hypothetical protein PCANC_16631 [Puccinia coronata f. sp. avenae]PLW54685.1 hypothetical protein PCANC_11663 [Puccinia coronata f. sp. avenae]